MHTGAESGFRSNRWHDVAAAHRDVGTGDIAGQIGGQKGHDVGDLLIFAAALEGHRRFIGVLPLRPCAPHLFGDRLPAFLDDLRQILREASPSGMFTEQLQDLRMFVWRVPAW